MVMDQLLMVLNQENLNGKVMKTLKMNQKNPQWKKSRKKIDWVRYFYTIENSICLYIYFMNLTNFT